MRPLRINRPHLIIAATIFSAIIVLSSLPQAAQHRQKLYNLAFPAKEEQPEVIGKWDDRKWGFQMDIPWYDIPSFRSQEIQSAPHNWKGPGHDTYATFFVTRNSSMKDPYFIAAQQVVYRVLWDPKSRSKNIPITVFVAPFISQEQRDYFTAAGAIVREVELHDFTPIFNGSAGRLKDMFAKLEMWKQTDFRKILYLDSDAFPLRNVDEVFDMAPMQRCRQELLPPADLDHANDICEYAFAGYQDGGWGINAGVLVLSPNLAMYERLVRESHDQTQFDNGYMEQSLLNICFTPDGPFPPSTFDHAYNGGVDSIGMGKPLYLVHHKLWATGLDADDAWYKNTFNETWLEMLDFYKTYSFFEERHLDNVHAHPS